MSCNRPPSKNQVMGFNVQVASNERSREGPGMIQPDYSSKAGSCCPMSTFWGHLTSSW